MVWAGEKASALGPTGVQPCSSSGVTGRPRSIQVRSVEALRPAWASWMAGTVPWLFRKSVIRRKAVTCSSFQMPRSYGLMRPSGLTAVASVMISPVPPAARAARWAKCQSVGTPAASPFGAALYWHIAGIQMRLGTVRDRRVSGAKREVLMSDSRWGG